MGMKDVLILYLNDMDSSRKKDVSQCLEDCGIENFEEIVDDLYQYREVAIFQKIKSEGMDRLKDYLNGPYIDMSFSTIEKVIAGYEHFADPKLNYLVDVNPSPMIVGFRYNRPRWIESNVIYSCIAEFLRMNGVKRVSMDEYVFIRSKKDSFFDKILRAFGLK